MKTMKMFNSFRPLILFGMLLTTAFTRPAQMDEREEEDTEYENEEETSAEDSGQEEGYESRLSDQDATELNDDEASNQQRMKLSRGKYQQRTFANEPERSERANDDNFSEYSRSYPKDEKYDESSLLNNDFKSLSKNRQSDRHLDDSDVNDPPDYEHLANNKANRIHEDVRSNELDKRTIESRVSSFDDSDSMYENNKGKGNDGAEVDYTNEEIERNEQAQPYNQYYNAVQQKPEHGDQSNKMTNRDRRQADEIASLNLSSTSTEKTIITDFSNQDDEAAIKKHIQKLSGDELEQLLNSLSDDKRALLNRIMDGDKNYESINKREITKKAGAVENGYIDSSLTEISKVQAGPSIDINTESAFSTSLDVESNKRQEIQTESSDTSDTVTSDKTQADVAGNKVELIGQANNQNSNAKSNNDLNNFEPSSDTKTNNKRDTNSDNKNNLDISSDDAFPIQADNYFEAKDSEYTSGDLSHFRNEDDELLIDEEAMLHNNNDRQYKRDIFDNQETIDDSIKSLEESFPNSNCDESGQYLQSNMVPLVRVKRKNENLKIKKRDVANLPEDKVAYFPYKAENDDEDTEEGNEFDDDGFYDRSSNYAKSNPDKPLDNIPSAMSSADTRLFKVETQSKSDVSGNNKADGDTKSLGTDTDSVLSGVEGVDENLMYNSGIRNKRTEDSNEGPVAESVHNRPLRSTPLLDEAAKPSENYIHLPNYQESAFGPLPRDEGELNRYKRIRRVKPSSTVDVTASVE